MTDKSSILNRNLGTKRFKLGPPGSQNSSWRHLGSAKGQPEALKRGLGEPSRSHRGCLETSLGSLGDARGGSGTCLKDAQGPFWSKSWPQTWWFLCKFFSSCFFWSCIANFNAFLFFPTFRIYRNLQWILHVFRFGPFQNNLLKVSGQIVEITTKNHWTSQQNSKNA